MLQNEKVLITGPAGSIAFAIAKALAPTNEVWGVARFTKSDSREEVEALGLTTRYLDLEQPDFSDIPDDFTYVVHPAVAYEPSDYNRAIQVNAIGTGHLLAHCSKASAALVLSTHGVYRPNDDPWYRNKETDPLGDMVAHASRPYSVAKQSQEAVARFCAEHFRLPVTIARMNVACGSRGGLLASHVKAIAEGRPVETRFDPCPNSPIHEDDIAEQVEPLLKAAAIPATIVNWCGDEVVTVQEWSAYIAELLGTDYSVNVTQVPGASLGNAADPTFRKSLTGPCRLDWKANVRKVVTELYPDRVRVID